MCNEYLTNYKIKIECHVQEISFGAIALIACNKLYEKIEPCLTRIFSSGLDKLEKELKEEINSGIESIFKQNYVGIEKKNC
jgi:hypothetical protein